MMNEWSVFTLRFTAFFEQPIGSRSVGWWARVMGADPDEASSRKSEGAFAERGSMNEHTSVEFKSTLNRFDILWQSSATAFAPDAPLPSIGNYAALEESWLAQIAAWIEVARPSINRIALGLVLDTSAMDRLDAYRKVLAAMPIASFNPENASDYTLQINFPIASTAVPGLKINRISKWNCFRLVAGTSASPSAAEWHFARCELDFNTSADQSTPFGTEQLDQLVSEAARQIHNVVEQGGACLLQ